MVTIEIDKSSKCNGDSALYVSFPYDNDLVNIMRSFPTRYWHKEEKKWELPSNKLDELAKRLDGYEVEITGDTVSAHEKKKIELPKKFQYKTEPYEHQVDGVMFGLEHDRWLLGDEQGLGKTKQVIDIAIAKKLLCSYKHCLIVCGVNGLKWNWVNEIHTHSDEDVWILGQRGNKIGSNADKFADIMKIEQIPAYFIVTNVETLRSEKIASEIAKLCDTGEIGMVAIDEIHKCFDYNTLITTDIGTLKIGDIVKDQISCSVLSYNETTGENEWKRIVDWHENVIAEQLLELQFETENGIKTIRCTKGHKFFTKNRGWVRAEDLTSYDDIQEF